MKQPQIIYEDNHLLVLNKPVAMPCVPDKSKALSLLDWAKLYIKKSRHKPGNAFVAVVHRLDRPVSGIVCFALTSKAASRLSDQIRRHVFKKTYLAICQGKIKDKSGEINNWLLKDRKKNMVSLYKSKIDPKAKLATTKWEILKQHGDLLLVKLEPITGRAHQLRAQIASIGAPILGDIKYGTGPHMKDGGIFLHAYELKFTHPTQKKQLTFIANVPEKFKKYFSINQQLI